MALVLLCGALIALGTVGTLFPVLPGLVLAWAGVVVYAFAADLGGLGWSCVAIASALAAYGTYLSVRIPQRAAAGTGMGRLEQLIAFAGAVVGFFVIPVLGSIVGFVAAVFVARWYRSRDVAAAVAATKVTVIASLRASLAQFACAVGIGVAWLTWVVVGGIPG